MKILIVFASTEGQTAKIAHFALTWLTDAGHSAALVEAASALPADLAGYDGVIVAGSVHAGRYQKELRDWVAASAPDLASRPSMFWSVSLSASGDDPEDWDGLRSCVANFEEETGWVPARVEHVAGAFRFSEYDFFKYWAMRWIASQKDEDVKAGEDREYTDWDALRRILEEWTGQLAKAA